MDIINGIIGCLPEFIECLPVLVFAFISPLLWFCLLAIAFVIIDKMIDILFYPLVIIGDIMNKCRQQKELENDPHYIEGINNAVWREEDDD